MLPPSARRLPDKGRTRVITSNSANMALFSMALLWRTRVKKYPD